MADRLCIAVCENFRREVETALETDPPADLQVLYFPCNCFGAKIKWDAWKKSVDDRGIYPDRLVILGGGCAIEWQKSTESTQYDHVIQMPGCHHLVAPKELIDDLQKKGAYLVTPGWLVHWKTHVSAMGFDEKTAPSFFAESARNLVLLDTACHSCSSDHLDEFSRFVGLPSRRFLLGIGYCQLYLHNIILDWRSGQQNKELEESIAQASRQAADAAMVLEIVTELAATRTEKDAVDKIFNLFSMLFGAQRITFVFNPEGWEPKIWHCPEVASENEMNGDLSISSRHGWEWKGKDGLRLRIGYGNQHLGILDIQEMAFPEFRDHYVTVAVAISRVCGLAISNALAYQKLKNEIAERKEVESALQKGEEHFQGLAEYADAVFHNVGNLLNGLCTAIDVVRDGLRRSKVFALAKASKLVEEHGQDKAFFSQHPKGKLLPEFYRRTGELLEAEHQAFLKEIGHARQILSLMKDTVEKQQSMSNNREDSQTVSLQETLNDAISLKNSAIKRNAIDLQLQLGPDISIRANKARLTHVFVNLIKNAIESMISLGDCDHVLTIESGPVTGYSALLKFTDTGGGIAKETQEKLFSRAFSTKESGHGFGLHYCSKTLKEIGGKIEVASDGPGQGAAFLVYFP